MSGPATRYASTFKQLLQKYPKEDGDQWRGIDIEHATNGFVTGSYVTALKRGRIARPGLDKLRAIADVMGFPFELWLEDSGGQRRLHYDGAAEDETFADRLNHLFDMIRDERTGEQLSNCSVAEMSRGRLSEETIERMRAGGLLNPGRMELLAFCDVFDVDFSYWDLHKERPPLMNPETLRALQNTASYAILHKSVGLLDSDKDLIVTMMDELQRRHPRGGTESS